VLGRIIYAVNNIIGCLYIICMYMSPRQSRDDMHFGRTISRFVFVCLFVVVFFFDAGNVSDDLRALRSTNGSFWGGGASPRVTTTRCARCNGFAPKG